MKRCFSFVLLLLGSFLYSCQSTVSMPSFQVEKVERLGTDWANDGPAFHLTLSSNQNIIALFEEVNAANVYLFCPLITTDFSAAAISKGQYCLRDYIFREDQSVAFMNNRYVYTFPVAFHGTTLEVFLTEKEIVKILDTKKCIDCKMVMGFLSFPPRGNLYSETFCLSVGDFEF